MFTRRILDLLTDEEYRQFQMELAANPDAGNVIPGLGGLRKIRLALPGRGKRGGARVIYFYRNADRPLYLLMVYAKARKEDLTPDEKRTVRELAAGMKGRDENKRRQRR